MAQLELDLTAARRARDAAMEQVEANADADWKDRAKIAVRYLARTKAEFISDDIWELGLEKPREARALGPIMRWAVKQGFIRDSGRMQQSAQTTCHARPMRVWISCGYKEDQ